MRLGSLILSMILGLDLCAAAIAAPVKGVVIDGDGSPVAKCRVTAVALESTTAQFERYRSDKPERASLASGESAAGGEFAIDVPRETTFRLLFEADGFAPAATIAGAGEEIGAVMLVSAAAKEGRVVSNGKGVGGARVIYRSFASEVVRITDGEGKFRAPDPAMWSPEVLVLDPRFAPEQIRRPLTQMPLLIEIREGSSLSGKVVAVDGRSAVAHGERSRGEF